MKKLLALLLLLVATPALAYQGGTQADWRGYLFKLNNAHPESNLGEKVVNESVHTLRAYYSFGAQGGAIGAVNLLGTDGKSARLPKGAIIRDCIIDVVTAATTSASGTIALGTGQAANDLKAATAAASYTGLVACVPVGTAATAIKLTADRTPTATIATGAITAGKLWVIIHYEMSSTTVP